MAAMQLQKAVTKTKTAVDQKHSLQLVQTILHSGLSTLAYIRDFFTDGVFDEIHYEASDTGHSYAEYASGTLSRRRHGTNSGNYTKIQVLRRGRSRRVDMFLNWLENGAFVALEAGHLHSIQIYVHPDSQDREKILEQYTFKILYTKTSHNRSSPTGLELKSPGKVRMTVEDTSNALQALIREIAKLGDVLPVLPAKRYISLELCYADKKRHLDIPGFIPCTTSNLLYPNARGWEQSINVMAKFRTLFHSSIVEIRSLQPLRSRSGAVQGDAQFPKFLEYRSVHGGEKLTHKATGKSNHATASPELGESPDLSNLSTASTAIEYEPAVDGSTREGRPNLFGHSASNAYEKAPKPLARTLPAAEGVVRPIGGTIASLDTIQSLPDDEALDMGVALQRMMQPEQITQGDTQSQGLFRAPESLVVFSKSSVSPSRLTRPTAESVSGLGGRLQTPTLLPHKREALERIKVQRRKTTKKRGSSKRGRSRGAGTTDVVDCQCGYMADEGDMVNCTYCDSWQHLHCYGYLGRDDSRLPDEHVCYKCLLGDEEINVAKKLSELSLMRRGIHHAHEHGLTTQQQFGKDMGWKPFRAGPIYVAYHRAGYVVSEPASRNGDDPVKPHLVVVQDGPCHDEMLRALFDPMLHIAHHYEPRTSLAPPHHDPKQVLSTTHGSAMLPPITPASRLRSMRATTTPGSGLDLPASQPSFRTPSRTHSFLTRSQKRAREQSESLEVPHKRQATTDSPQIHYRHVQSEFVLDASGMPSSPMVP